MRTSGDSPAAVPRWKSERTVTVRRAQPQSPQTLCCRDPALAREPFSHAPPQNPPHLLNSGSFSRSSRAEWQVIRVRSNCAISSAKVLPIWFSAKEGSPAAQLPHP